MKRNRSKSYNRKRVMRRMTRMICQEALLLQMGLAKKTMMKAMIRFWINKAQITFRVLKRRMKR